MSYHIATQNNDYPINLLAQLLILTGRSLILTTLSTLILVLQIHRVKYRVEFEQIYDNVFADVQSLPRMLQCA